jgi:pimeloyl-ACP methyl ester carboxylesterase
METMDFTHMGGLDIVPMNIDASMIAEWILPQHREALALNLTQSTKIATQRDGWSLMQHMTTLRIGVWQKNFNSDFYYVVGCRATGIGMDGASQDIKDDEVLSGKNGRNWPCGQLHIKKEGTQVLDRLIKMHDVPQQRILVCGYSLGGAAALCLGEQFTGVQVASFFGGAPATNPRWDGPGPERATHYTVVGDLVSSHCSPEAARIIRVDKGYMNDWGTVRPHLSGRFLKKDPTIRVGVTADEADEAFVMWATTNRPSVVDPRNFLTKQVANIACHSPIPGSQRMMYVDMNPDTTPCTFEIDNPPIHQCRQFYGCL